MTDSNVFQTQEDGQLRIAIKEDQINVAPEGQVRIHVALINEGPSGEYVDLRIQGIPAEWIGLDTPTVYLPAGEAKQVILTIRPTTGPKSRVGEYPLEVRAVSQGDPRRSATVHRTLTVAAYQSRGRIGVLLGSIHFSVSPGSSVEIPILLKNRGEEEDSFRMLVSGIPSEWISTESAVTRLAPAESTEVNLVIQVPRAPEATAGRTPFSIHFTSQGYPTQTVDVNCILTVLAFSQFSATLEPDLLRAGQFSQVVILNEGNTVDAYSLGFRSPENALLFEKAVQVARPGPQPGTQQIEIAYVEIPPGDTLQVAPGSRGVYPFRSRLRSRPILGSETAYPFTVDVRPTQNRSLELSGQVSEAGYLPVWLMGVAAVSCLILCLALLVPLTGIQRTNRATQTASYLQTQTVLSSQEDPDGDGLTSDREASLGTDPLVADTDLDGLRDGEEVDTYRTNPLDPDTDRDGLPDGEEVLTRLTDPLNPDTDADGLLDGDEIARGTNPLNRDSDSDGLPDGEEIRLQTNPLNPDTDNDRLLDGQENETCPRPLDPDSDDDGLIDGSDLDPCNPGNPAMTATALAGAPTLTATPPVATPTITLAPTLQPAATPTPPPPSLQGLLLFGTNRDGNNEIYVLNLADQTQVRLTNHPAQDVQPALAPDSVQYAFVSNRDGNNEIYLSGVDGRTPLNLTSHAGDDQQPAWSPDGNWIVFTSNRDGNQEIYVMRRDGSDLRNITNNPANDFAPAWFSTGGIFGSEDWIAFTTTRDGNQEVYKVRPDGSGLTNLTQNPANDHSPSGIGGGASLVFVTDRTGNPEVYTMTYNGVDLANVTNNPAQDLEPALHPTGGWIAFSTDRDGNLEVYVVRIEGGTAYNLTRNPGQDRQPDW